MTELDPSDIRKKSVTARERDFAVMNLYLLPFTLARPLISLPPDPPFYWSFQRDIVLRSTIYCETMWAASVGIACTKMQNAGYSIEGSKRKVAWAHDLLADVDFHRGWKYFIQRSGRDYLNTDNGAFIEIIRSAAGPGSKIVGLAHLDSLRCRRTGDDEIPVVYRDIVGAEHELRSHQVFSVVDLPDPSETLRGVGYCAASRAYNTIYKMAGIERYIAEKATGQRPLELVFMSNVSDKQLGTSIQAARDEAQQKGLTAYMGAAIIATQSDQVPAVVSVPLASIPDGIDIEKERHDTYLRYANAIGLDSQEIMPLSSRSGGGATATQSVVLDEKERGKFGWFEAFSEQLNLHKIVGGAVTFTFTHKDWRDQQLQANVQLARAQARQIQVTIGEIDAQESRQLAAQAGDIPQEFLDKDVLDQQTLYDNDNPEQVQEAEDDIGTEPPEPSQPSPEAPPAQAQAQAPATVPPPTPATPKETPAEAPATRRITRGFKLKARGAVDLANITPDRIDDLYYNDAPPEKLSAFIGKVTKELEEYGDILTQAARAECPQHTGALMRSIGYEIQNRGTKDVQLHVYAGNKERPEVVVRSNLYGHRGFGPKSAKGVLHFTTYDGKEVFTKHVDATDPNDWFGRAWDRTEPQRRSMIGRIGRLGKEMINEGDVPLKNKPHIDGYKPVAAKLAKGKELWTLEPVTHGTNGHNIWEDA